MRSRNIRLVVALVTLATPLAARTQTPLGTRAAVGPGETLDWATAGPGWVTLPSPSVFFAGLLKVSVASSAAQLTKHVAGTTWMGGFTPGDAVLYNEGAPDLSFAFSSSVNAFALQLWHNWETPALVTFSAFREGVVVGTFGRTVRGGGAPNLNQAPVLGFSFDAGFDAVTLVSAALYGGFGVGEASIAFTAPENDLGDRGALGGVEDDLLAPVTTTPEPATAVLVGTGLLAAAAVARRRR